jgi:hypothetical protein
MHGKAPAEQLRPSTPFTPSGKESLEDVTGRMPIFLRVLAAVKLEKSSQDDDCAVSVDPPAEISGITRRLTRLYDGLWMSTLIWHITGFWHYHETHLTDGGMAMWVPF